MHPTFYPYVIYFTTLIVGQDYTAVILISIISAIVTFFILYRLLMMLTGNFLVTFITLIFFTLSVGLIISSNRILKESFLVMMLITTIYFYVKGVKFNNNKSLVAASIFGGLSALTADHAIFLFPVFVLTYIFFKNKKLNIKYVILPIIITGLVFGSWMFIKTYQYATNEYYPAGLEGAPVSTKDFGVMQVLDTVAFDDYDPNHFRGISLRARHYAFQLGYMFNMFPFSIPQGLNFTSMEYLLFPRHIAYMAIIYLPLALIAIFGFFTVIKEFIKKKKIYNNVNLYILFLFLIFIFPVIYSHASPRYIFTAYLFLFYFISFGFITLFRKRLMLIRSKIVPITIILLLILIPFWYFYNDNFVLFNKKFVYAQNTGEFINNNLEKEGAIMAQSGYGAKLNYLTDNRVLGLPPRSKDLLPLIDYYNVSYVVYGKYYTWDWYYYNLEAVEFIRNHPEKFELIAEIPELIIRYGNRTTDRIYIYKVINEEN